MTLGSWFLVLGSWFLVLGSWFLPTKNEIVLKEEFHPPARFADCS
jgi:hypothetical protein